jgi:hypothetical protein
MGLIVGSKDENLGYLTLEGPMITLLHRPQLLIHKQSLFPSTASLFGATIIRPHSFINSSFFKKINLLEVNYFFMFSNVIKNKSKNNF